MEARGSDGQRPIDAADWLGRRSLILGEVNAGKTRLCRRVLEALLARVGAEEVAILDLAPEVPAPDRTSSGPAGVGGRLAPPPGSAVLYLSADLAAPRLSSRSEAEALAKAEANRRAIEPLWLELERSGRPVVLINDLSLYLQAGRAEDLMARLAGARTVAANGYYGLSLGGGELSRREQAEMDRLKTWFDRVIRLEPPDRPA